MSHPFLPPGAFFSSGWMPYKPLRSATSAAQMPYVPTGGGAGWMPYVPTGGGAGWMPYVPTGGSAGWMPYVPTGGSAGQMPYVNAGDGGGWMPDPIKKRRVAGLSEGMVGATGGDLEPGTNSPWPWQGTDPQWVYGGEHEALLAQGLRKMRSKITSPRDPRLLQPVPGVINAESPVLDSVWRWQPAARVRAVVAEMLCNFCVVGTTVWHLDLSNIDAGGVGSQRVFTLHPPARDGSFVYDTQIDKTLRAAVEREDRLPEILSQMDDLRPYFNAITGLDRVQAPLVHEVMQIAWDWSTHLVMALKNMVAELRPVERSALLVPVIATPGHGSLPSGHATMAKLTADILCGLLYAADDQRVVLLDRLARRIAFNRTVAGVHFPMDNWAGYELGRQLASTFVAHAQRCAGPAEVVHSVGPKDTLSEDDVFAAAHAPAAMRNAGEGQDNLLARVWAAAGKELSMVRI
jgi:hypothetical protein